MAVKRMTAREKKLRAQTRKRLQEEGILPPDKPRLDRKRFIEEAKTEWNTRSRDCYIWEHHIMDAMTYMLGHRESSSCRLSLEAVGAAKILKLAVRLHAFREKLRAEGRSEYKLIEEYDFIKDILDA